MMGGTQYVFRLHAQADIHNRDPPKTGGAPVSIARVFLPRWYYPMLKTPILKVPNLNKVSQHITHTGQSHKSGNVNIFIIYFVFSQQNFAYKN